MMVKPTVKELLKVVDNRYALVVATSKRARQLATGSTPLTSKKEASVVTLAADEIAEGKVYVTGEKTENEENTEEKVEENA